MTATGITVTGLRETISKMKKLGVEASDLKAVFERGGRIVANDAKTRAPRETGRLAASIRPSKTQNKALIRAGKPSFPTAYAVFQHYGWSARDGSYYLVKALLANEGLLVRTVEQGLSDAMRKAGLV